jgi:hypothetical protein
MKCEKRRFRRLLEPFLPSWIAPAAVAFPTNGDIARRIETSARGKACSFYGPAKLGEFGEVAEAFG